MTTIKETFEKQGYVLVKGFIPKNLAKFLYDYLVLTTRLDQMNGVPNNDPQVMGAFSAINGDPAFEVLLKNSQEKMEECTGLKLIPTYTFRRLYGNGNVLAKHKDRPSCEISATIKLSDSGGYNWPIWMVDTPYELEDGDAVIYRGCDLEHWRDECKGPSNYVLGQLFIHYVDESGALSEFAYDKDVVRANLFKSLKDGFIYQ